MKYLLKRARIIDNNSAYHGKIVDVLIDKGVITSIEKEITVDDAKLIESKDLHISTGWIDLQAHIQDPGYEYKEDILSAGEAAASGGFTRVCVSAVNQPVSDNKGQLEYIFKQSKDNLVEFLPFGAVSKNAAGKELADLADMHQAGAIAFSDGKRSCSNPNLLYRALRYCQSFEGLVFNFPHTASLAPDGVMNEGVVSTELGLKGLPEIAEEIMLARDLSILEYTGGKLHFHTLSSPKSLQLIAEAKKKGLQVSCDIATYHLLLSDENVKEFDSRYKTIPPLRSKDSINGLIKAVKKGVIDALCSDHYPEDIEQKKREFNTAAFGIINLQTAFSSAYTALHKHLSIDEIIPLFTSGPANVLGIENTSIDVGVSANLTVFDPSLEFQFTKDQVLSKSNNSPFFNHKLKGRVIACFNRKKAHLTNHHS